MSNSIPPTTTALGLVAMNRLSMCANQLTGQWLSAVLGSKHITVPNSSILAGAALDVTAPKAATYMPTRNEK